MKVSNMTSPRSYSPVANQFILTGVPACESFDGVKLPSGNRFQSYRSMIAHKDYMGNLYLDNTYWDYSRTTAKYRNRFTGLNTAETKAGIADGSIKLVDLN